MVECDRRYEQRLRGMARRRGCRLTKARGRRHMNNQGAYQLVDNWSNTVILGANYETSLEAIERYLITTETIPGQN
jgi:hypothetical protein